MLSQATASYGNVRVEAFHGLLVDFCERRGGGRDKRPARGQ